jgi:hypothetical protein
MTDNEYLNYFEPCQLKSGQTWSAIFGDAHLRTMLPFDNPGENQLSILYETSFEPNSHLLIEKHADTYTLTYTWQIKHYWGGLLIANNLKESEKKTAQTHLPNAIGDKLFEVLDNVIQDAREPNEHPIYLDGVEIFLSRILSGQLHIVSKHVSTENSELTPVFELLFFLKENINNLNDQKIAELKESLRHL